MTVPGPDSPPDVLRWHLFGAAGDSYLFGPSAASAASAAPLGDGIGKPYRASWDHEPTQAEIDAAFP